MDTQQDSEAGYEYSEEMLRLYFSDRQEYIKRKENAKIEQIGLIKSAEDTFTRYAAVKNVNAQIISNVKLATNLINVFHAIMN